MDKKRRQKEGVRPLRSVGRRGVVTGPLRGPKLLEASIIKETNWVIGEIMSVSCKSLPSVYWHMRGLLSIYKHTFLKKVQRLLFSCFSLIVVVSHCVRVCAVRPLLLSPRGFLLLSQFFAFGNISSSSYQRCTCIRMGSTEHAHVVRLCVTVPQKG